MTNRATLFDLDDTLLDSGAAWDATCAAYTAVHGHAWTAADAAALHGNGNWSTYVSALCGGIPPARVIGDCTRVMVETVAQGAIAALPGAVRLAEEAGRFGSLALVSASPRRFVEAAITHLGLAGRFRTVVCGEDVTRPKPAPDPYLRAARELGVDPGACVVVEDSPNGIRSAHAAGMTVLAIPRAGSPLPADAAALAARQAATATEAVALLALLHAQAPAQPPAELPAVRAAS